MVLAARPPFPGARDGDVVVPLDLQVIGETVHAFTCGVGDGARRVSPRIAWVRTILQQAGGTLLGADEQDSGGEVVGDLDWLAGRVVRIRPVAWDVDNPVDRRRGRGDTLGVFRGLFAGLPTAGGTFDDRLPIGQRDGGHLAVEINADGVLGGGVSDVQVCLEGAFDIDLALDGVIEHAGDPGTLCGIRQCAFTGRGSLAIEQRLLDVHIAQFQGFRQGYREGVSGLGIGFGGVIVDAEFQIVMDPHIVALQRPPVGVGVFQRGIGKGNTAIHISRGRSTSVHNKTSDSHQQRRRHRAHTPCGHIRE